MEKLLANMIDTVSSAAVILSLSKTMNDEEEIKRFLQSQGYVCAVTEVGGKSSLAEFQERSTKSIIGACLNCNIIKKDSSEIHSLLHAAEEAKKGVIINVSSSTHLSLKVAIVRKEYWLAVAMYGDSAVHYTTNHQRIGLGVMHI